MMKYYAELCGYDSKSCSRSEGPLCGMVGLYASSVERRRRPLGRGVESMMTGGRTDRAGDAG